MIRKTRSSSGWIWAALLVFVALLTFVPVGLTRHSAGEPVQKTIKPKKQPQEYGDIAPWTLESIGKASEGTARKKQPEIQIRGASEGFGQTRDSLHFLSQESEGNFEMSARIDAIEKTGLGGLMVRVPGRDGGESYFRVAAHRTSDGRAAQLRTVYKSDQKKNAYESRELATVVALPVYLKLRRLGSVFSSSFSSDGLNYRDLLRIDSKGTRLAARELNVGMVQSSESGKVAASVLFKGVRLESTEPRVSELVSAGIKEPLVGGVPTSGAIVRSSPAGLSSGVEEIAYLKSDSAFLKVPARVVFSRGRPTATFEVHSVSVNKPTPANLTVTLNGKRKTVKVNIMPQDAVASLSVRPSQFFGAEPTAVGTVNLVHPAPTGGTRVLVSSSSSKVQVPQVVTVPAGKQSVQFGIRGVGVASDNAFVTVSGGSVLRDAVVDFDSIGPVGTNLDCPLNLLTPDVATDGQRVYLSGAVQEGARVFVTGYRYNDSPPTRSFPGGEGRERIYCGCQRAAVETFHLDGIPATRPYFVVPMNAPSGDYAVEVRPKEGDCPAGGIGGDVCPTDLCSTAYNLFVAPSYIVNLLNRLDINANAEDEGDHPPEMKFWFGSLSGTPIKEGDNPVAMVSFSGSYPGEVNDTGHLTNADLTQLFPHVPLYIGSEWRMIDIDCREECKSLPAGREAECMSTCQNYVAQQRFSDHFEFTFAGTEHDTSPSQWWGVAAGIPAAALGCYLTSKLPGPGNVPVKCGAGGLALGGYVTNAVNDALRDDDDKLGSTSQIYQHTVGGFGFGSAAQQGPFKLGGDRDRGDIDIYVQNFRVGGPQILQYTVKLRSLTVLENYDGIGDCQEPNEVFLQARAFLYEGGPLTAAKRFPTTDWWSLNTGETENFGGVPLVLEHKTFTAETAQESPLIYVELAVWEDDEDEDKDLMGIHSETFLLTDLLSNGSGAVTVNEISSDGLFIRRARLLRSAEVWGYENSDDHCVNFPWATATDADNLLGRVNLEYEIEVTWLKRTRR